MAVKLGSDDVSFRLGSATPSKVAIGAVEVWTDVVPTVPGIPTALTVETSTGAESAVEVSWTAPESDGGSAITGYKLYRSLDGETYTLHSSPSGTSATVTVPYSGGGTIYIKVSAVNAAGEGSQSEVTAGTLSDSPPSAPTSLSGAPQPGYDIFLTWAGSTYASPSVTDHEVSYASSGGIPSTVLTGTGSPNYTLNLTDGDEGVEIEIRIRAINSLGDGEWSEYIYVTAADVPDAPTFNSVATSTGFAGALDVSLNPPANNNGSAITGFDLEYALNADFSDASSESLSSEATTYSLEGLQGGASYYLRLRAVNAAGAGEWSVYISNPVAASTSSPSVPTAFSVSPDYMTPGWLASWTEASDGGSSITQYEIEEADADFFSPTTEIKYDTGSSHSWSVAVADQLRYFRIRAVNSIGASDWTEWTSATYDTPTVPGAPTINVAEYMGGQTYIAYLPPEDDGNSTITGYTFYFDGSPVTPDVTGANDATFNSDFTGQDATMTATNGVGEGAASAAVEVTAV
jgi:hypothetical protein